MHIASHFFLQQHKPSKCLSHVWINSFFIQLNRAFKDPSSCPCPSSDQWLSTSLQDISRGLLSFNIKVCLLWLCSTLNYFAWVSFIEYLSSSCVLLPREIFPTLKGKSNKWQFYCSTCVALKEIPLAPMHMSESSITSLCFLSATAKYFSLHHGRNQRKSCCQ